MPKLIGGQRKETAMAKREYTNCWKADGESEQTALPLTPEPAVEAPKVSPKKGTPKKGTKRVDTPPSRFEQLRAKGRSWVDGVVDALDDTFARLDAHEERLDEYGRRLNEHEDRFGELSARVETLEQRPAPEPSASPTSVIVTIKVEGGDVSE